MAAERELPLSVDEQGVHGAALLRVRCPPYPPPILPEGVLIRSYIAHTDGLKDAAPMRAGE